MEKSKRTSIVIGIVGLIFAFFAIRKDYRGTAVIMGIAVILASYTLSKINQVNKNAIMMKELNRKMDTTVKTIESYIKLENRFDKIEQKLIEHRAELNVMRGKKYGRY